MTTDQRLTTTVCSRCWHVVYEHNQPRRGTTEAKACRMCACEQYKGATKREEQVRMVTLMGFASANGSQWAHDHLPAEVDRLKEMS